MEVLPYVLTFFSVCLATGWSIGLKWLLLIKVSESATS